MPGNPFFKAATYYLAAFVQGICLLFIPAASFIFKAPETNAITDQQYGLLFLPMMTGAILVTVFFKNILHRWGTVKIYFAGFLSNALFLLLLWFVDKALGRNLVSFVLLLTANFFLGSGFGLLLSVLNFLCVELFSQNRDSMLTGMHSCLGIGSSVCPLFVSLFYARGAWTHAVLVTLAGLVALLLVSMVFGTGSNCTGFKTSPVNEPGTIRTGTSAGTVALPAGAWMFLALILVYGIAEAIIGNWSSIYLNRDKGFSLQTASLALSTFWMFVTVGRVLASFLVMKVDARYLYRLSPACVAASLTAILMTRSESRVLLFYVAAGLSCSYFFPFSVSLSTRYFEGWHDRLASMAVAALMLGVGVGSVAIGFLRDRNVIDLGHAFMIAIACAATAACAAFLVTRRKLVEQSAS